MKDVIIPDPDDGERERSRWPDPIDLAALAAVDPQPPPMIIDDWLPAGYATLFAGHGDRGKSSIALQLACSIALGRDWCGLPVAQRRVLYLSCEDRTRALHWRLRRYCDHTGINMEDLAGCLHVLDLVGSDTLLYGRDPLIGSATTAAYGDLARLIRETGAEVVFVDGVSDTYGENENDRTAIKRFVNTLVALIDEGRGAVILVHHVNKVTATAGNTSEGYSGSTGWHNAVRARWYLYAETTRNDEGTEDTGDLLLALQKSNLGRRGQMIRYRWDDGVQTFVGRAECTTVFDQRLREGEEREGIMAALRDVVDAGDYCPAAANGTRTAFHVLSASKHFPASLSDTAGRRRFWRHIEVLRRNGEIVEGAYRRANRHKTPTLVPQAASQLACADASNQSADTAPESTPYPGAPMRRIGARGTRGARAHGEDDKTCPACDGEAEGCAHCRGAGVVSK